ncbi:hypothetical protein Hbut_1067 [Hyperthermus butylicus DSM 5456]|uniref:Uncharacterized protein n=2 Tax=Hyperthermus butylicus TaxID=54248 RepID=A2BLP9_HYPBU|nr:hypothetical protein Hbut_1067 [Hyperthermus butylicus DSM 5456]
MGVMALRAAEQDGRLRDAAEEAEKRVGPLPLLTLVEPRLRSYLEWVNKAKARRDVEELEEASKVLVESMARAVYLVALAATKGRISRAGRGGQ